MPIVENTIKNIKKFLMQKVGNIGKNIKMNKMKRGEQMRP